MTFSIVRNNLLNQSGYTPYCGLFNCTEAMPRTKWDSAKGQFVCKCGWSSSFEPEFIKKYKEKWNL